jgi:hypothetical protein
MRNEAIVYAFAYGGLLFDLLIVPMLGVGPLIACLRSLPSVEPFIYPIGIFPWLMLGSLVVFFPPGSIRRLLGAWPIDVDESTGSKALSRRRKVMVVFLLSVFAFQAVWPLRQFLYPGDAGWTGEGDLFAWRMMLYRKFGETAPVFTIVDPEGKTPDEKIDSAPFLNSHQIRSMQSNPDLILQFAHFLHRDPEPRGLGRMRVQVRAGAIQHSNRN